MNLRIWAVRCSIPPVCVWSGRGFSNVLQNPVPVYGRSSGGRWIYRCTAALRRLPPSVWACGAKCSSSVPTTKLLLSKEIIRRFRAKRSCRQSCKYVLGRRISVCRQRRSSFILQIYNKIFWNPLLMRKKRFFAVAVGRGPSRTFYVPCPTLLRPKSYSSLTQVLKIGEQTRTNYGFGTAKTTLRHIATTDYEHVTAVIGQSGHKWT